MEKSQHIKDMTYLSYFEIVATEGIYICIQLYTQEVNFVMWMLTNRIVMTRVSTREKLNYVPVRG